MRCPIAALAILAFAAPATATISDTFDSEGTPGVTSLNHADFANWQVIGRIDLIDSNAAFGIVDCSGKCVDLAGSPGPGALRLNRFLSVAAGDLFTIELKLAGNGRDATIDNFLLNFDFGSSLAVSERGGTGYLVTGTDPVLFGSNYGIDAQLVGTAPSQTSSLFFRPERDVVFTLSLGTDSRDNKGPVIDNVIISGATLGALLPAVPGVPEPATWAMMITGFGLVGFAMRRRRLAAA